MATLSKQYKEMLLKMTPNDITADFMYEYIADRAIRENGKLKMVPSKMKTNDTFTLEANEYFNKTKVVTNVGLFIFNKFIIEESFSEIVGYINDPISNKVYGSIEDKLSLALMNDVITVDAFVKYLNKIQWLGMQFNSIVSSSFTEKTIKPLPSVKKRKEELIEKNKDKIINADLITIVNIENELKTIARKELENDPGMDLYNSGARGSFDNNYKNINIMKGPVFNPAEGKWEFAGSNYTDGIDQKEIPIHANAIITGTYPKSVGTQVSGYLSKQLLAAFQGIVLDVQGSDCGTKNYLKILITPWVAKDVMYRYIVENGKLVLLDDNNISKYIGKTVMMRSPMFCVGEKLCSKCAGDMYYKLGIKNIGLTTSKVSSTLLNLNMKKFHDSTAKITKLDLNDISL